MLMITLYAEQKKRHRFIVFIIFKEVYRHKSRVPRNVS